MFSISTINVNGIRAAVRKGGLHWLQDNNPDVVLLQEVRATPAQFETAISEGVPHFHEVFDCNQAGRAGVAIMAHGELAQVRKGLDPLAHDSGRWLEATVSSPAGPIRVVSVYVHSGEVDTDKQVQKYAFLEAMTTRMMQLRAEYELVLVSGDINIAHTPNDIKNAKGNIGKAGFLEQERDYLSQWLEAGWVDLAREFHGDVPGPYTWWSMRGQAFDRDTGWRLDYGFASAALAEHLQQVRVDRAPSYDTRWSDHAPVTFDFDLG